MKKKSNLLIINLAIFAAISIGFIPVFASNSSDKIDVDDAIKYTVNKNLDLKILNTKVEIAKDKYDKAEEEKNDGATESIESERKSKVYPLQKKKELNDTLWNLKQKKNEVTLESTKLYYNILIQQEIIDLQNSKIDRINKEIEQKKKEIELGNASSLSLDDYTLSLDQAKTKLQELTNEKKKLIMELNIKMGNPVDKKLILKQSKIPEETLIINDLTPTIEKLIKENYTITAISDEITYTTKNKEVTKDINSGDKFEDEIDDLKDKIVDLKYDLEDEKKNIEYKIISDYNNLLNLQSTIDIKKLDYENKLKLLKTAEARKKLGLITSLDYNKTEEDANDALAIYKKSKLDYYIAMKNFKFFINEYTL